ncbi:MAG: hypothetical protein JWQ81_2843 [Amycolatopsis sp.]|nr:hypothetical protein [Amycolatopsis sp.]
MEDVTVLADREAGVRDTPAQVVEPPGRTNRLTGIDVARGLAVLGMYAVHVGPDTTKPGLAGAIFKPFEGHPASLFAVLAGVSISLMAGGHRPKTGRARTRIGWKLGTRAPLMIALGLWLTNLDTGYLIILAYYGVTFIFAIPFLRWGVKALVSATVVAALVFPFVSWLLRGQILPHGEFFIAPDLANSDFTSLSGLAHGAVVLVFTGTFPAFNLMTYIFAGMAIGRLNLGSRRVCRWLFGGGFALSGLGYLLSWLGTDVFGGMQAIYNDVAPAAAQAGLSPQDYFAGYELFVHGSPPTTSLVWELLRTGSSYTPFDFIISIGLSAGIIGGCQLIAAHWEKLVRPVADIGSMVLSAYAVHLFAIHVLWPNGGQFNGWHFVAFCAVGMAAAVAWRRWIGRGPLEWALHTLSRWPDYAFPSQRRPPAAASAEPELESASSGGG